MHLRVVVARLQDSYEHGIQRYTLCIISRGRSPESMVFLSPEASLCDDRNVCCRHVPISAVTPMGNHPMGLVLDAYRTACAVLATRYSKSVGRG
jgi:hypothetical protein